MTAGTSQPTALSSRTQHEVDMMWHALRRRIEPWGMAFYDEHAELKLTTHDGRQIFYRGVSYSGSPQAVFWGGYIEPFLKEAIITVLDSTLGRCRDAGLPADVYLREAQTFLQRLIRATYRHMSEVDYRLRTRNHQLMSRPPKVRHRDISSYVSRMNVFLAGQVQSSIAQSNSSTRSPIQESVPTNRFESFVSWSYSKPLLVLLIVILVVTGFLFEWFQGLAGLIDQIVQWKSSR